jgi:outer membrane protein OmpA-like peptidoglycan-associated protein
MADELFAKRLYGQALQAYNELITFDELRKPLLTDSTRPYPILKAAKCYSLLKKYDLAENYYSTVFDDTDTLNYDPLDFLDYAEVLLTNEKRSPSLKWFDLYYKESGDQRGKQRATGVRNWQEYYMDTTATITNLSINSRYSEIAPSIYADGLVYSANTNPRNTFIDNNYLMGEIENYSLYFTNDSINNRHDVIPVSLSGLYQNISSPLFYHAGAIVTANSTSPFTGKDKRLQLNLYRSDTIGTLKLGNLEFLSVNEAGSSSMTPFISQNGDTLIFASNRPKGYGGFDLYMAIKDSLQWGQPENMGETINTSGDELYPFMDGELLYFSSNGHSGIGGFDIYHTDKFAKKIYNLNYPINSPFDDFGLSLVESHRGYFASNRTGGKGRDDIYYFEQGGKTKLPFYVQVVSTHQSVPISNAALTLVDASEQSLLQQGVTDSLGHCHFKVNVNSKMYLTITKSGIDPILDTITYLTEIQDKVYEVDQDFTLKAFLFSSENSSALSSPTIFTHNLTNNTRHEIRANTNGYFELEASPNDRVAVVITKEGYSMAHDTIRFNEPEIIKMYALDKIEPAETVTLTDLLYELNQHELKGQYHPILDSIATSLMAFSNTTILVISHTDSKGSDDYNYNLSQQRAESVVSFFADKGISRDRLVAEGKGESELLNECADGVACSEAEHKRNRRTEIQVFINLSVEN